MNLETENDIYKKRSLLHRLGASTMALGILASQVTPALATIDNTATASGTYNSTTTNSNSDTVHVAVQPAAPSMTVVKTATANATIAGGANSLISDAGDTITYTYVVKNTGNVTITNALPVDGGPKFHGSNATGTLAAFVATTPATSLPVTLIPGASQTYTATYTLSQLDVDRSAGVTGDVTNSATATGTPAKGLLAAVTPSNASSSIPAGPKLTILKTASPMSGVALGDIVTYTYTVTNSGNVAMTDVSINDTHAGSPVAPGTIVGETLVSDGPLATATPAIPSADTTANDGVWHTLQPGAVVKFTWSHVVTQAEIDAG